MYQFYVGIDVSKHWIDVAFQTNSKAATIGQFDNSEAGFARMHKALTRTTDANEKEWFVCFENTGSYSKPLLHWLIAKRIPCIEQNPIAISRSKGLTRGSSDAIDAKMICTYAYRHRDELTPTVLPHPAIAKIRKLLSRRALLVRQRASLKASLTDQRRELDVGVFTFLNTQNETLIRLYSEQIEAIDSLIKQTLKGYEGIRRNAELVQSVVGIGPVISWYLIAFTNNFSAFANARKFACYVGVAPFPETSGTSKKGKDRVHFMANKKIKALLSNGAQSAVQHDNEQRLYYTRKIQEGKEHGTVINAVKNKLLARAFSVVKRQSPYVRLGNYA